MKKIPIFIGLILLLSLLTPTIADDSDFAENESYYRELCTSTLSSEDRTTCTSFQEYLNSKVESTQSSIDGLLTEISDVENDIAKVDELMRQQQEQIVAAEAEIVYLDESITVIQDNIVVLEEDIAERGAEIQKVDKQIKDRLVSEQGNLYTNSMVNFLFGGQSYTEMVRRADTVNKINEYNKEQMDWFTAEKIRLEDDQEELGRQKDVLEVSLQNVLNLKETLEIAKAQSEQTIAAYQAQVEDLIARQAELEAAQSVSSEDLSMIQSAFVDLDTREEALRQEAARLAAEAEEQRRLAQEAADEAARIAAEEEAARLQQESEQANQEADEVAESNENINQIGSAGGWMLPVSSALVSAGPWYYPGDFILGGSPHYGVDFAAPVGTSVFSAGPGVVVYSYNGCDTYGWLGNGCGGYGGNQVVSIISVNNSLYGVRYLHLQSAYVGVGTVIDTGTVIGAVGSSGSSTGPHLHYEVFYLGEMSLNGYLNSWDGSTNFSNSGVHMNLNWTCDVKGPPCRVNPLSLHGLSVGQRY